MASKTGIIAALSVAALGYFLMRNSNPTLHTIPAGSFVRGGRDWLPNMDRSLVLLLDVFFSAVAQAGGRAYISPHPESLGRTSGNINSDHYAGVQGNNTVYGADVMIEGLDIQRAYNLARDYPFTALGVYTDTRPAHMLHLSTRPSRTPQNPALWSRVGGEYGPILAAFV